MRRSLALIALLAVAAAGCNSGDDDDGDAGATTGTTTTATTTGGTTGTSTEPERLFTKQDLPKLALPAASAPPGMTFTAPESGPKELIEVGVGLPTQLRELRALGFVAVHDAIFDSSRPQQSDLRVAERLWLFGNVSGASSWLQRTRANSFAAGLGAIQTQILGDASWAAGGSLVNTQVITHAFRVGNVVVVMTSSTERGNPPQDDALAAAQAAEKRITG